MSKYISPEYQEQLDQLATNLLRPISEEQLCLEWNIQEAIQHGVMTVDEGAECLTAYQRSFDTFGADA